MRLIRTKRFLIRAIESFGIISGARSQATKRSAHSVLLKYPSNNDLILSREGIEPSTHSLKS